MSLISFVLAYTSSSSSLSLLEDALFSEHEANKKQAITENSIKVYVT
ncbi:hypothetical protein B4134_3278 [Bacillus safensis]|nr:hypothetical protein B4134_3278 [Bacillus safensis]